MNDHYFSAQPTSAATRLHFNVKIQERTYAVETLSGIFSPQRLDIGTSVLLRTVAAHPQAKNCLDIGCGWGPITLALAQAHPHAHVWAIDVNERALALTRANVSAAGFNNVTVLPPTEILAHEELYFDEIWANPPVRIGKTAMRELVLTWLKRLSPTGRAVLVIGKNLGADSFASWLRESGWPVTKLGSAKGFRVLAVYHPDNPAAADTGAQEG